MKKFTLAVLTLFLAASVSTLRADVTPTDVKDGANEKIETIQKNTQDAKKKVVAEKPPKKKKRKGFFEGELSKDRSQPREKVPMTDDKVREKPYKNLGSELTKERG